MRFSMGAAGAASRFFCVFLLTTAFAGNAKSDPYPPAWTGIGNCGTAGNACHFKPAPWPSEPADPANCGATCGDWQPYTRFQGSVNDPRVQDPSNGGTRPQNYVNIASSCSDQAKPSIYYSLQQGATPAEDVIMFRWRVEQIANTYATGPSPGSFGATDPWNSALWTVLFDVDGDGFRDLAAHLDGSSGGPSVPVDRIAGIWGNIPTQSIDYVDDPSIHLIAHNPTGFVDSGTGRILNFQDSVTPTTSWPNGSAETTWDYGTTRARLVSTSSCNEYFIDYQIPVKMLDATSLGGPSIDRSTPLSMLFCTANSLNNPFQKDCAINKDWAASSTREAPFGDYTSFDGGNFEQPIVDEIEARGCGIFDLSAKAKDTIAIVDGEAVRTIQSLNFYYYRDDNGNGIADDGNTWQLAANGSPDASSLNAWSATWDATALLNGQYLLGVQALDDPDQALYDDGITSDGIANRTFSYLSKSQVDAMGPPPAGENWYANPSATGVQSVAVAVNACGVPTPFVDKSVTPAFQVTGGNAQYTITVHNTLSSPLAVTSVTDHLPSGFSYVSTDGGTLSPDGTPTGGATGDIQWTFASPASIPAGGTGTIAFTAQVAGVTGTYQNTASASTDFSATPLDSGPVAIEVGQPRLTIAKSASVLSAVPGGSITYTIDYANDSSVNVTGAVITDVLPDGLSYVSGADSYDSGTRTLTWNIGNLAGGSGTSSVGFDATVDDPYPGSAAIPLVNTATIDSDQTAPASDDASIYVDAPRPRLTIAKSADTPLVAPGGNVTFTLRYANSGNADATGVVVTDTIPAGFSFVSASGSGTNSSGVVTWNVGSLASGSSGSVTLTLQANDPFAAANPATNLATVDSDGTTPVSTTLDVGVTQAGSLCQTYYFRDQTGDVGADGTRLLANTAAAPQPSDTGGSSQATVPGGAGNYVEVARFYQDPATPAEVTFSGSLTTQLYIDRTSGPGITLRGTVYDYDSGTGTTVQLGQGTASFNGSHTGLFEFTVPLSGTLQKAHRLLWVFEATSNNTQSTDLLVQYDGTVANTLSGSGSTFADSNANFCVTPPANLVVQKDASPASVVANDTITYTIQFANTGQTDATGATLVDTLPAGVSFDIGSATVNGTAVTPAVSGQQLTFGVNSSDTTTPGLVTGGNVGALTFTATVNDPVPNGVSDLVNNASLESDQTSPVTDDATTPVEGAQPAGEPQLVVEKSVTPGGLKPGDTASYTITVLNAGTGAASNVVVTDDVPDTAYYSYVASSISGGDTNDDTNPGILSWTINSLPSGSSATLGFDMAVANSGVPAGTTFLDNQAGATRDGLAGSVDSGVASVAISASPDLVITKSVDAPPPVGYWQPGDTFEYTLVVTNQGNATADVVSVSDPLPDNTAFEAITQGSGGYQPATNRVSFDLGALTPGGSAAVSFSVRVRAQLPGDQALIDNTAVASAGNAASVQDSAFTNARAVPEMSLQKTGPSTLPFPAATVSLAASASTTISVDNAQLLSLGDTVRVAGQTVKIANIGGTTLTLDQPVTVSIGDPVQVAGTYAITWSNTGTGTAQNVQIADSLPGSFEFVSADPMPSSVPGGAGGTVTWDLGAVAPGTSGTYELTVFPTASGSFANSASLTGDNVPTLQADKNTDVGGLRISKSTSTPVSAAGGTATWTLSVENTLPTTVTGVSITDVLPSGFTFNAGTPIIIGGAGVTRTSTVDPADGEAFPTWGVFSIPAGATLTLTFEADIAGSVGPATYQNDLIVDADNAVALPFDPLSTTAEDVTVLASDTGIVEGYVYRDVDGDGSFSPGDTPYAGINVEITDAGNTQFIKPTDSGGYFRRVVAAGNANLDVGGGGDTGIPAGFVLTTGATDPSTVSVPNGGTARRDTGYVATAPVPADGTLDGHVFLDANGNGMLDPGEGGIGGVEVDVTTSLNDPLTVFTDASGDISFTTPGGDTDMGFVAPAGYVLTTANATQTVTVPEGGSASAQDVGYTPANGTTGSLDGHVFLDADGSGTQDPGEPNLAGIAVDIQVSGGGVLTVATDDQGDFSAMVAQGSTQIAATGPTGYSLTTGNATQTLSVPSGGSVSAGDIGFRPGGGVATGQLALLVFQDDNGNSVFDPLEPRFGGVLVVVQAGDGSRVSLPTAPDGTVSMILPAGVAGIQVFGPAGFDLTTANESQNVAVPEGGGAAGSDVGYRPAVEANPGEADGTVFEDANRNGVMDAGENGITGVIVTVTTSTGATLQLATGPAGQYSLLAPAGVTRIAVTDPAGLQLTTANRQQDVQVPAGGSAGAEDVGYAALAVARAIPALGTLGLAVLVLLVMLSLARRAGFLTQVK